MTPTYPGTGQPMTAGVLADGSTVNHLTEHGRTTQIWENLKHYGAYGDGSHDDYAAIQAVLDAMPATGGVIRAPTGTFKNATATWTVQAGTRIEGFGQHSIFVNSVPGGNPLFSVTGRNDSAVTAFRKFRVNGPDVRHAPFVYGTGTGTGILLNGGSSSALTNTIVEDVVFEGVGDVTHWCIDATWALETRITRCVVTAGGGGGFRLGATSNASVIRDCVLSNNAAGAIGGIDVASDGMLVQGNVIEGWRGLYGVKVESGMVGWNLIRNWHEDNDGKNLWLDGSSVPLAGLGSGTVLGCNVDHRGAGYALYAESVHDTNIISTGFGSSKLVSSNVANMGLRLNCTNATFSTLDVTGLVHATDDRLLFFGASTVAGRDGVYLTKGGNVSLDKGYFEAKELASSPSTPATDYLRMFAKDDDGVTKPHFLTADAVEWRVSGERAPVTLTDAATVTVNAAAGHFNTITLTGARTFGAPANPTDGQEIAFFIYQNTGGPITPVWNGAYLLIGGTFSINDNSRRCIKFTYWKGASLWVETGRV